MHAANLCHIVAQYPEDFKFVETGGGICGVFHAPVCGSFTVYTVDGRT